MNTVQNGTRMATNKRRQNRANSKEAYRLWFEFLKRAIDNPNVKVDLKHYKAWGDVANYKFDRWWKEIGSSVIDLNGQSNVSFATDGINEEGSYLVRIPKTLTSTEAANQLRQLLLDSNHKQVVLGSKLKIRNGAEIRPLIYRAYLHTYDRFLELTATSEGKKVTARQVLIAVRKFYIARAIKYKNSNRRIDKLPSNLHTAINLENLDDVDVLASAQATATISRYIKETNKIIENVAKGVFP
jgi:hypothetical protein